MKLQISDCYWMGKTQTLFSFAFTQKQAALAGLAIFDTIRSLRSPVSYGVYGHSEMELGRCYAIGTPSKRSAQPHARIRLAQPEARDLGSKRD